ncbi:MAG: GH36-type glycosyl hydrolase domain-containing protein [Gemmataceae bacterium]
MSTPTSQRAKTARRAPASNFSAQLAERQPSVSVLSNGRYSVMMTAAGGSYGAWNGLDVTRWREDATRDCWGQFCYVRNLGNGQVCSATHQPIGGPVNEMSVEFRPDRVEYYRRDGDIETRLAVCVAPDCDAEVRELTLTNCGSKAVALEITSYAEVCLNHRRADLAHPAFAKLFLETEFDTTTQSLLARRRPRGGNEKPVYAVHLCVAEEKGRVEFETDRSRFLGRGRTPANPIALSHSEPLSNTVGSVLDPIFSLRRRLKVEPGSDFRIAFVTGAAETREGAIAIAEQFEDFAVVAAAFADADVSAQKELQAASITPTDVDLFNRLSGAVLFAGQDFRSREAIEQNRLGQPALWPFAISGDLPIVLARIARDQDEALVNELIRWHSFVRRRGVIVDVIVLDSRGGESVAKLTSDLQSGSEAEFLGKPGGTFVLEAAQVPPEVQTLIAAAARIVLDGNRGKLSDQLQVSVDSRPLPAKVKAATTRPPMTSKSTKLDRDLRFWNGSGGFTRDGREYVIAIDPSKSHPLPPAPWANVLANPDFGCLATESGLGFTWAGNSQMNRLTPWSNDPVSDSPTEIVYLHDEDTGETWTPTPLPLGMSTSHTVRHGPGYTRYSSDQFGLAQELTVSVAPTDPVKLVCLTVRNESNQPRNLSATFYVEWVLGTVRENAPMQVVTERDRDSGAVLARNAWAGCFADKVAFLSAGPHIHSATADRSEFLGRNASIATPAALGRVALGERFGAGLDPCGAVKVDITLAPQEAKTVVFVLGQADNVARVRELVRNYIDANRAPATVAEVSRQWDELAGAMQVSTPDVGMNLMLNRWLPYQVLACRIWARSAYYQSGGAYGFRDQLQDVMALVYGAPHEARAQILRAAARQFEEGDVQHWWHPPSGIGVRTRITDDLMFLPLVVHHYITTTGDMKLLDEVVPFITSPVLREGQEEDFGQPAISEQSGTIYEHCVRALTKGLRFGSHGIPLMGTGDWNDGMNKVGAEGKGESVWNGWFFVSVLNSFAELAEARGDKARSGWCQEQAETLRASLEANAWDGMWYRRAYFDDGTPLGSSQNDECQIDAIPQAWAVISGRAKAERTRSAMLAVNDRLVRAKDKLIQLFDPPFDKSKLEPGYIKGYVPGIRENGGQYTHAAAWVVLAIALEGNGDRAVELWNLINPVYHATTPEEVNHYKVEPYVVCADVYGAPPHTGRGGWTWYTGSASWLYRVAIEAILGFYLKGETLRIEPCIPKGWPGFELTYRYRTASYHIQVENPAGKGRGPVTITVDRQVMADQVIRLADDGLTHEVRVQID